MDKVRKGNDVVLNITMDGNKIHVFNDIKTLRILVYKDDSQESHIPTTTATNQCCNQSQPTQMMELSNLVTSSDKDTVVIEALFPASLQTSGVYRLLCSWEELTDNLIAENDKFTYTVDLEPKFELVSDVKDITTNSNNLNFIYNWEEKL